MCLCLCSVSSFIVEFFLFMSVLVDTIIESVGTNNDFPH